MLALQQVRNLVHGHNEVCSIQCNGAIDVKKQVQKSIR